MPWEAMSEQDLRREFVVAASREGANVRQLCRRFGISAKTGYKWLSRYRASGEAGLVEVSRRPHGSPSRVSQVIEAAVLEVRVAHPAWGGRKIKRVLERTGHTAPAASTVTQILRRNGIENLVPMIRTREIESVMRIANGQTAVLGGLMEDRADYQSQRVPILSDIPLAGEAFNNRNNRTRKTELVIFLRPVVIKDASLSGDFAALRQRLPDERFFSPPPSSRPLNPGGLQ